MAQSKEIKEILAKLQTIQQQINNLENKVEKLNTSDIIEKLENISTTIETTAIKAVEDKERQRSLVLIGLKESTAVRPTERAKADEEEVLRVLDALDVQTLPLAVYRMGNPAKAGPNGRLIKVILPSTSFQRICLAQWKKKRLEIRSMEKWTKLLIRPSLTAEQLRLDKEERDKRRIDWQERNKNKTSEENVTRRTKNY
uniref:Uncharacterized protein n=1 Tax=Meloidogyne enterolobii TaxID=390850 RepID=A0A6V7V8S3_MELEN|nr:unnamed protein product [Meloidogyne enterolobii]